MMNRQVTNMAQLKTLQVPVRGMDCNECVQHVQQALSSLPGVESATVFLASEKANIQYDPTRVNLFVMQKAVKEAGYTIPNESVSGSTPSDIGPLINFRQHISRLLMVVFAVMLFSLVIGEWLGLFDQITTRVPWPFGLAIVLVAGYPIFMGVMRATRKRQVTSHTLMTVGVIAALIVGQWVTAIVVVFFMRVGSYTESFTTDRARRAVKNLTAMAPQTARVVRAEKEIEVPIAEVQIGETVIVYPGEKIPVDGLVIDGQATINQATITGESLPVEVSTGSHVYAATIAQLGHLRVQATQIGTDSTFGRVIRLVEEAEAQRGDVQRLADKFSTYYLPVVMIIAVLTLLLSRNPLATAAVLVVACSCSIAMATPIAMLASIGLAAQKGLLIKGGKYIELLARADVVLIDKTGTLTLGKPQITDIIPLNGLPEGDVLRLAASAERYSEHPLAQAVRTAAQQQYITLLEPSYFEAMPGIGVRAQIEEHQITVGSRRLMVDPAPDPLASQLEAQGKTLLYVTRADELVGMLAAADTFRTEVPEAIGKLRAIGIQHIELLTGDNERTAATLADKIGITYRANLLPENKIQIVKEYQAQGHIVVMIGDGVNDAPALAQANIGIAMGAAGSDIAIEAAHIALMREDWLLVPEVFHIARRTMRVVKMNLAFTAVYNVVGLTLAAFGLLPPIWAAAVQSLPDLGILGNSARLLRDK